MENDSFSKKYFLENSHFPVFGNDLENELGTFFGVWYAQFFFL